MDNPTVPHEDVSVNLDSDDVSLQVAEMCIRLVPGWQSMETKDIVVDKIGGGITNVLLRLTHASTEGRVVVRVFGDNTEYLIDRERELRTLSQLNTFGFGAKILATFINGRVEEFLHCRTLTTDELSNPNVIPQVAARLARFHSAMVDEPDRSPKLWNVIDKWLAMAKDITFEDAEKREKFKMVDFRMMEQEVAEAQALCESTHSPVVYSHNDLLAGNILVLGECSSLDDGPLDVQLIDFEYSSYGFRGFDWGNHFNEWAGFECEWSKYPTMEQQHAFIKAYLEASSVRSVSPEQVAMAIAEANAFSLASHIYWGIWALTQARYSPIDFDYLGYSGLRWARYHEQKSIVKELVLKLFPPPHGEPAQVPFPPAFPEARQDEIPVMPPVSTAPVVDGHIVRSLPM